MLDPTTIAVLEAQAAIEWKQLVERLPSSKWLPYIMSLYLLTLMFKFLDSLHPLPGLNGNTAMPFSTALTNLE